MPADIDAKLRAAVERAVPCLLDENCTHDFTDHGCARFIREKVIDSLAPIIAEAQRDTARLDWLEDWAENDIYEDAIIETENGKFSGVNFGKKYDPAPSEHLGHTFRAAIDAARTPEAGDGE